MGDHRLGSFTCDQNLRLLCGALPYCGLRPFFPSQAVLILSSVNSMTFAARGADIWHIMCSHLSIFRPVKST